MSADPNTASIPPDSPTASGACRAIVVGASSGMGAAIVRQLAGEGCSVAAVARREDALAQLAASCAAAGPASAASAGVGRVIIRAHDASHPDEVPALFEDLVRALGGLDLLVYAAGIMPKVERTEYDTAKDLAVLATNLGGCIAWGNAAAALFRSQRSGTIVGISSIAGDRGRKGFPVYAVSKAGMDCYLEALRNRLAEANVHVCTIKPGYVDTSMTRGLPGLFWLISAEQAAAAILSAARSRVNVRYVPYRWRFVGLTLKLIPSFVFRRLEF